MKNIIFTCGIITAVIAAAVATAIVGMGLNSNEQAENDTTLANIEALAAELPEVTITCSATSACNRPGQGQCWDFDEFYMMSYTCKFVGSMSKHCCY